MQRAQGKMLREYFSGVPIENLSKRYGFAIPKIKQLASDYKQGKIDIFDDINKRKIAMSMMSHQEEVQMLKDKIKALEHALKMSNIKAEGYEIMMDILKKEHGIDLSKKSRPNSPGTQRKAPRNKPGRPVPTVRLYSSGSMEAGTISSDRGD